MKRATMCLCLFGLVHFPSPEVLGQTPKAGRLQFEVASVKPSLGGRRTSGLQGGPGTSDPGRMIWTNSALLRIITYAYALRVDQLSAPAWLGSAFYDISAKVPPGTTREQSQQMLQNLLIDRFHLAVHHETKTFAAYNLVSYRGKPKLTPSSAEHIAAHISTEKVPGMRVSPNQTRIIATGYAGSWKIAGEAATLADLAVSLSTQTGRRVVDRTGLTGSFDFMLEFSRALASGSDTTPYLFDALREQLGLDLQETKLPVDVVVIDRIDKTPIEN